MGLIVTLKGLALKADTFNKITVVKFDAMGLGNTSLQYHDGAGAHVLAMLTRISATRISDNPSRYPNQRITGKYHTIRRMTPEITHFRIFGAGGIFSEIRDIIDLYPLA